MRGITQLPLLACLLATVTMVIDFTLVTGCSEPEGGFTPPGPEDNVYYSDHVIVGTVTELLKPDPAYGDTYKSTYGAKVTVRCSYKGGPLTDSIIIGGAGFIPGLCTAKDLKEYTEYIIFLRGKDRNGTYEQSQPAEPSAKIMEYISVCDLERRYPMENGVTLKRKTCPAPTELSNCKRHTDAIQKTPIDVIPPKKPPVVIPIETGATGSPQQPTNKPVVEESKDGDNNNNAQSLMTSSAAILLVTMATLIL